MSASTASPGSAASSAIVRFAEANGVVLRYIDQGPRDARTVFFLHPLGADLHLWDAVSTGLAATHRVIRYDLRGHAGSEVGSGPITMDDHVSDLVALLDRLGVRDATLAGVSCNVRLVFCPVTMMSPLSADDAAGLVAAGVCA